MNSENVSVIAERIANSGVASHHRFEVRVMMFNATLSVIYQLHRLHIEDWKNHPDLCVEDIQQLLRLYIGIVVCPSFLE